MPDISHPRSGIPVQGPAIRFVHSTLEFTVIPTEVKLMAIHKDLRNHQYLEDWLVRARSHQACLQHTQELVSKVSATRLAGELREIRAGAQTRLQFVGYQFNPQSDPVRLTPDRWQNLQEKMLKLLSLPACPVREFRSVIGLLTATEKQVHVGQLHMRLIQWHHKHNWRVPESLEKVIPTPRSLHPHLQ